MKQCLVGVQLHPWDNVYHFDAGDSLVKIGEVVIVKTDQGLEWGTVTSATEVDSAALDSSLPPLVRRANRDDMERRALLERDKEQILERARQLVKKYKLAMKLVDSAVSFDGGRLTFIFTADGRVDFRELVKEMARMFQKSIRLQQIGIRDEAKRVGGLGPCGRPLCCRSFMKDMGSISTEMARMQQVHSRGSDRISGSCGRLMCCLSYEADFYSDTLKKFPPLESKVKTKHGKGIIIARNVIKKTVTVRIDQDMVELPIKEVKIL